MTQQFYKLTLSSAIALYQNGLISATALVYFYIRIKLKPGWKLTLHQRPTCSELGIQKTAFYKAIGRLKEQGLIDWEAPNGLVVSIPQTEETFPQSVETFPQSADISGQIAEKKSLKPASIKASVVSPNSYQIFSKSLSDTAREKFFNFVREKVKDFKPPINDLEAWLAGKNQAGKERFRVYYEMFQTEVGEAAVQDWEKHPKRDEWIAQIREGGKGRFIAQGGPTEEWQMRKAFAEEVVNNNLVWGNKP
jgi:hypothetical protein